MFGVTDIWTYVLGTIAIILLPGPNSLYVLATAAKRGVRTGYQAAFGVFLGDAVLMFAAAAGVASLLRAYPPVFFVLKWAGAGYLAYLGIRMIFSHAKKDGAPAPTVLEGGNPFKRALTISLMNPKAILFFISFFIQFVDPAYAYPALSFLVLGVILTICSALYLTALIFGGNYLAAAFRRRRVLARIGTTAVGALFIGFGARLALS
jgi:leucine efflux protein